MTEEQTEYKGEEKKETKEETTNELVERLEAANKKKEELLNKEEALKEQSGSTQAGIKAPENDELTPEKLEKDLKDNNW
jgi:predicted transcriptional regulator